MTTKFIVYKFSVSPLLLLLVLVFLTRMNDIRAQEPGSQCSSIEFPDKETLFDFKLMRSRYSATAFEGFTIGEIKVVTLPVFNTANPRENNDLYEFVNYIHSPTRDYVVQRQLLFQQGDILENRLILESERLLRENSYLSDAIILPDQVCGNSINLVVVVRDLWTLLPKLFYSRKGGNNKYGLTLEDENVLGTGNTLYLQFINERERDTSTIGFKTRQLFGSRLVLNTAYSETSDGINKQLELTRPFYSLDTRWSLGLKVEEFRFDESLEAFDEDINGFVHFENNYSIFAGYSLGLQNRYTQRFSVGINRTEDLFEANANTVITEPANRKQTYPWLKYSIVEDAFAIYRNLNALYRTEDVPVGTDFSVLIGYSDKSNDEELSQWIFSLAYNEALFSDANQLLLSELLAEGYHDRNTGSFSNTISSIDLSYYWLIATRHRFFLGLSYDYGENLTQDYLMPLGGDEGLRGYPTEYLLGDRRFLSNMEYRYFLDTHFLNLFRFAGVVFFDTGETKISSGTPIENSGLLSSGGIGLRINSSKTNISRIIHIDLAFPFNEKDNVDEYLLRITSDATF